MGRPPKAEMTCSARVLAEWFWVHLRHGGADPKVGLSRTDFSAETQRLQQEWAAMPPEPMAADRLRAQAEFESSCGRAADTPVSWAGAYMAAVGGGLWGLSSVQFPLSVDAFEAAVRATLGKEQHDNIGGATRYCNALRARFSHRAFVAGAGDIPPERRFVVHAPCWEAHPGLCRERDRGIWLQVTSAGRNLQNLVFAGRCAPGDSFKLTADVRGGAGDVHGCLAYLLGSKPKLALFALCVGHDSVLAVQLRHGILRFVTAEALFKEYFHGDADISRIGSVSVQELLTGEVSGRFVVRVLGPDGGAHEVYAHARHAARPPRAKSCAQPFALEARMCAGPGGLLQPSHADRGAFR